jgi:hypothetical protein
MASLSEVGPASLSAVSGPNRSGRGGARRAGGLGTWKSGNLTSPRAAPGRQVSRLPVFRRVAGRTRPARGAAPRRPSNSARRAPGVAARGALAGRAWRPRGRPPRVPCGAREVSSVGARGSADECAFKKGAVRSLSGCINSETHGCNAAAHLCQLHEQRARRVAGLIAASRVTLSSLGVVASGGDREGRGRAAQACRARAP